MVKRNRVDFFKPGKPGDDVAVPIPLLDQFHRTLRELSMSAWPFSFPCWIIFRVGLSQILLPFIF